MSRLKKVRESLFTYLTNVMKHHVGAYAAQSAYFFMLALIPMLLLLTTMIQLTGLPATVVIEEIITVFPKTVTGLVTSIINQVYRHSSTIIPVTILVALWSAGKGVMALTGGLNLVYSKEETRNYFFVRIRATIYTVLFILVILIMLILSVFGNTLRNFIVLHAPFMEKAINQILELRTTLTPAVTFLFSLLIFKFLPNRKAKLRHDMPGAVFTSLGWFLISYFYSVYLSIFKGFANMYGTLTTIILLMLWMYFCMYCVLLGAELNVLIFPDAEAKYQERKAQKEILKEENKLDK